MNGSERVIVALDVPGHQEAFDLVQRIGPGLRWVKVGMELYYAAGPSLVLKLKDMGLKVFLDLKVMDIPNTARGAMCSLARLGADMVNVHCSGGIQMMQAAREGLLAGSLGQAPKLIGVTLLTSINAETLQKELVIPETPEQTVLRLAGLAEQAGLDGVVASAKEVRQIKQQFGQRFLTVTPGIRPVWAAAEDQARVAEPGWAVREGSDYLVVGRPITKASEPRKAFLRIVQEIEQNASSSVE